MSSSSNANMVGSRGHHGNGSHNNGNQGGFTSRTGKPGDLETFPGFKTAIEACSLDWSEYPIQGVTYGSNARHLCPLGNLKVRQSGMLSHYSQVQCVHKSITAKQLRSLSTLI